jgi:biopolymer transport protein ExbD
MEPSMEPILEPRAMSVRINLTPIIDVALVLVIILLITAPMLVTTDIDIQLPEATTRGDEDQVRLNITVGKTGEVAIDDDRVTADQFEAVLRARLSGLHDSDALVVVRADAGSSYETLRSVIQGARNAGAKRLAIATRPHQGGRS